LQIRSGKDAENIVEQICSNMFFSDFVVRNPTYTKPSGKRIELADLLIPFGDTLLAFQVKSKFQLKKASEKSSVDFQRIENAINEAVDQVKTIKRALKNDWLRGITTVRGFRIDVDPSDITEVAGLVILDLVGEESLPQEERTQLFGSFTVRNGLPIHVFLASEFFSISSELDTLTDFTRFLKISQELYNENLIEVPPSTLDLLAFHKMYPDSLKEAINTRTNVFFDEGMWDSYNTLHANAIAERDRLNEPSYLIDGIIDYLHSSVGYEPLPKDHQLAEISGQGTVDGYMVLTREIASLSRLERRSLGERLLRCLNLAMERGEAHSALILEEKESAYLVYSKSGDRTERQVQLQKLTAMLYCHLNLKKVVGIATEPMTGEGRSYDAIGYSGVVFKNASELAQSAKEFFGEPYPVTGTEYTRSDIQDAYR